MDIRASIRRVVDETFPEEVQRAVPRGHGQGAALAVRGECCYAVAALRGEVRGVMDIFSPLVCTSGGLREKGGRKGRSDHRDGEGRKGCPVMPAGQVGLTTRYRRGSGRGQVMLGKGGWPSVELEHHILKGAG